MARQLVGLAHNRMMLLRQGQERSGFLSVDLLIALMRVFPKAIVLTTKSHFHVKRTYASIRGLVVRTITSGKTRISAID